jgi:hypothetical protein
MCVGQVLASFLVQDLEAEGLNPFLLTYIANSLFIVYLPLYYSTAKLRTNRESDRLLLHPSPHHAAFLLPVHVAGVWKLMLRPLLIVE